MRIRYVAFTLAAGVAASAFVLSAPQARAADYPDRYSSHDDQGYDDQGDERYDRSERRVHVEERYVDEEPIVEERVVRRSYAPPVVVVGPGFYGPRRFYGPRYGFRGGYYGRGRWAHRGRW